MCFRARHDAVSDLENYVKVAMLSAKAHAPSLVPILMVDGAASGLTAWFALNGGIVLFHELSFVNDLPEALRPMTGAFLRLDIPLVMNDKLQLPADVDTTVALYTDVDVMFLRDISTCSLPKPAVLALGAEVRRNTLTNTGVMFLNLNGMREHLAPLLDFARAHQFEFGNDQPLILDYFTGRVVIQQLPDIFNHKPYWGAEPDAVIVHFHGPKPGRGLPCLLTHRSRSGEMCKDVPFVYQNLFLNIAKDGGRYYNVVLQQYNEYLLFASISHLGCEPHRESGRHVSG